MSGTTRSIPNISSSGNIRPQSITTMSSPNSNTYMFLPISPTPPSGMMRRGRSGPAMVRGSEERGVRRDVERRVGHGPHDHGLVRSELRLGRRLASRPGVEQRSRDQGDVGVALALDLGRAERGGRVVEG